MFASFSRTDCPFFIVIGRVFVEFLSFIVLFTSYELLNLLVTSNGSSEYLVLLPDHYDTVVFIIIVIWLLDLMNGFVIRRIALVFKGFLCIFHCFNLYKL